MARVTLAILLAALLMGCAAELKGPSLELKSPLLRADHGHGFCPPGQAKKGAC
jgi:hypothetical protein